MDHARCPGLAYKRVLVEVPAQGNLSWRKACVIGQGLPQRPAPWLWSGGHNLVLGGDWQVLGEQLILAIEAADAASTLIAGRHRAVDGQLGAEAIQFSQFGGVSV